MVINRNMGTHYPDIRRMTSSFNCISSVIKAIMYLKLPHPCADDLRGIMGDWGRVNRTLVMI